jgi:hypothetical protein
MGREDSLTFPYSLSDSLKGLPSGLICPSTPYFSLSFADIRWRIASFGTVQRATSPTEAQSLSPLSFGAELVRAPEPPVGRRRAVRG